MSDRNSMARTNRTNNIPSANEQTVHSTLPAPVAALFKQLDAQDVNQFYHSYQRWQQEQQLAQLQRRIAELQQQSADNAVLMQLAQPTALALATLTRLQSYGVDDIGLLDKMLERGDSWLDHAMQLLEHCEQLGVIHGNYTEWCEHALEGAYDWIDSMNEVEASPDQADSSAVEVSSLDTTSAVSLGEATEASFLQKIMSDEDTIATPETDNPVEATISPTASVDNIGKQLLQPQQNEDAFVDVIEVPPWEVEVDEAETSSDVSAAQHEESKPERHKHPLRGLPGRVLARVWGQ